MSTKEFDVDLSIESRIDYVFAVGIGLVAIGLGFIALSPAIAIALLAGQFGLGTIQAAVVGIGLYTLALAHIRLGGL